MGEKKGGGRRGKEGQCEGERRKEEGEGGRESISGLLLLFHVLILADLENSEFSGY